MSKAAGRPKNRAWAISRRGLLQSTTAVGLAALVPGFAVLAASDNGGEAASLWQGRWPIRPLLQADLSKLLDEKGRGKTVYDRKLLDDMESDAGWEATPGVILSYTTDRAKDGTRSLRFSTLLRNEEHIAATRRPNGSFGGEGVLFEGQPFAAHARLRFSEPQDWSAYNRVSVWAWLHPTTNPINVISLQFLCEGASAGPLDPVAVHYIGDLRPGEWNHLVWEIPEHQRDRVIEFALFQTLSGVSTADADPHVTFDFDQLAVERVDAERPTGWTIDPGTIAYCHVGYQPMAQKVAIAGDGPGTFDVLDAAGTTVASYPAEAVSNARGSFHRLDFSALTTPGTYRVRHGEAASELFTISDDAWDGTVVATLNAFYGLRCGFPLPGVHDACHRDVFAEHEGERRSMEGGWHDAANLTQSPYRTHLSIYALLELHASLAVRGKTELAERALEEALWGLDWSIRTRFGPGLRALYNHVSYWTDNFVGTNDDVIQDDERSSVGRDDFQNTLSVLAAARAARCIRDRNPSLAANLLRHAREDFALVSAAIAPPADAPPREINEPSWRDRIGYATLAAVELYRASGDDAYAEEAVRLSRWLIGTQERRFVDGIPITGYFYEDAGRTRIVHEYHNSFEDCGLLAFAALCDAFPNHPEWMEWYAGLAIYAEHFCGAGATASAPFDVVPAAVWRRSDLDAPQPYDRTGMRLAARPSPVFPTPPTEILIRQQMQQQYDAGTQLGPDHCLRVFPLWYDHIRKGATTVHMSKTIGLGAAAATLNRSDLSSLATRQVQWVLGTNPFSRSLLYGVGNAFWQNFTVALPNFVGGMSLGFNSYEEDAPAWGNNAVFPYKEMWVYSSCRMALNLSRVGAGARLTGEAPDGAELVHEGTGANFRLVPGVIDQRLPAGRYRVRYSDIERTIDLADGSKLAVMLDPSSTLAMEAETQPLGDGRVKVIAKFRGTGRHALSVRAWNADMAQFDSGIDLRDGEQTIELTVAVRDSSAPWFVHLCSGGDVVNYLEVASRRGSR